MSEKHTVGRLEVAGPYPTVTVGFPAPELDDPDCGVVGFNPLAKLYETAEAYGDCGKVPDAQRLALCWNAHDDLLAAAKCAANVLSLLEAEVERLGHRAENVLPTLREAIAKAESRGEA